MIYLKLFLSFMQIGLFSIGGGYAAMPLIESVIVDGNGWLNINEFSDLVTIAEMTPGPIAINAATFVGLRIGGVSGAICATLGSIVPSLIIVSALAFVYFRYKKTTALNSVLSSLRPAVVALIAGAGISILISALFPTHNISFGDFNIISAVLFILAFIALRKTKLSPILIMSCCGVLGLIVNLIIKAATI